jgi:hypothetical protein
MVSGPRARGRKEFGSPRPDPLSSGGADVGPETRGAPMLKHLASRRDERGQLLGAPRLVALRTARSGVTRQTPWRVS